MISHGSNGILAGAREVMRAKAHFPNVLYKAKMTKSSLKINIRCLKMVQMICNSGTLCNMMIFINFQNLVKIHQKMTIFWPKLKLFQFFGLDFWLAKKHHSAHTRLKKWFKDQTPNTNVAICCSKYSKVPLYQKLGQLDYFLENARTIHLKWWNENQTKKKWKIVDFQQ